LIFAEHFERHDAIVQRMARTMDPTHAAGAEQALDPVRGNHVARPE
jgi:hypothetical protein